MVRNQRHGDTGASRCPEQDFLDDVRTGIRVDPDTRTRHDLSLLHMQAPLEPNLACKVFFGLMDAPPRAQDDTSCPRKHNRQPRSAGDEIRSTAMSPVAQQKGVDTTAVRPFEVNVPETELAELRRRVNATRWP